MQKAKDGGKGQELASRASFVVRNRNPVSLYNTLSTNNKAPDQHDTLVDRPTATIDSAGVTTTSLLPDECESDVALHDTTSLSTAMDKQLDLTSVSEPLSTSSATDTRTEPAAHQPPSTENTDADLTPMTAPKKEKQYIIALHDFQARQAREMTITKVCFPQVSGFSPCP